MGHLGLCKAGSKAKKQWFYNMPSPICSHEQEKQALEAPRPAWPPWFSLSVWAQKVGAQTLSGHRKWGRGPVLGVSLADLLGELLGMQKAGILPTVVHLVA